MESKDGEKVPSDHNSEEDVEGGEYEEEKKSDINFRTIEGLDEEKTATQPTYQIRPPLFEK